MYNDISPALTVAATLSARSPFLSPFEKRAEAERAKRRFARERDMSDHLVFVRAYDAWLEVPPHTHSLPRLATVLPCLVSAAPCPCLRRLATSYGRDGQGVKDARPRRQGCGRALARARPELVGPGQRRSCTCRGAGSRQRDRHQRHTKGVPYISEAGEPAPPRPPHEARELDPRQGTPASLPGARAVPAAGGRLAPRASIPVHTPRRT
jgi:hypothetical protein